MQNNDVVTIKLDKWIEAKRRHKLSDLHIQMARELGLNPDKLGKIDNHKQEMWKAPLPQFIEQIYYKRFKRDKPLGEIKSAEQIIKERKIANEKKKKDKLKKRNMKNRQLIAVFDNKKILEALVVKTEADFFVLSLSDILFACENKTSLGGRFFRLTSPDGKISPSEIDVLTLDEFDKRCELV